MVLVTGANGQIGRELQLLSKRTAALEWTFTDRMLLDITNEEAVVEFFKTRPIEFCINCAAYTAVDKAEEEIELATKVNKTASKFLAEACKEASARLIHFSSDYVYHNAENRPLKETDETSPKGVYAQTKLEGEELILATAPTSIVIRTSWVYSAFGGNFVKSMLRLGRERDQLNVIYDQIGAPTYAAELATLAVSCVERSGQIPGGVYNFANSGVCSWYDFAQAIFEQKGISCKLHPILSKDYPTPAKRPNYSVLDTSKIRETLKGFSIRHWRECLRECLELMDSDKL